MSFITAYCSLTEDVCSVNGTAIIGRDHASADSWFKQIYKQQELAYPKFYKMDMLSQAGFLASELIKRAIPTLTAAYNDDEIALVFANRSSSAETDQRFINSYEHNGAPSPSLFVYTLPNIVLGEIAILNKWYGENMFAVLPKFAPDFYLDYLQILHAAGSKAILCGWLEVTQTQTEVLLFMVEEKGTGIMECSKQNLAELWHASFPAAK
ncbi:hypothetical protein [Dyadobacter sp. MSC1_007]|jgi:hypothetical protein|uniref:hypothetical protein n=1 Tax=Dyadobacter sp. MSC1_007 TaxID=2909264 RepID=UPI00202F2011|nr:hypothetical protein [Dyadobacter sp. MSC1_007]